MCKGSSRKRKKKCFGRIMQSRLVHLAPLEATTLCTSATLHRCRQFREITPTSVWWFPRVSHKATHERVRLSRFTQIHHIKAAIHQHNTRKKGNKKKVILTRNTIRNPCSWTKQQEKHARFYKTYQYYRKQISGTWSHARRNKRKGRENSKTIPYDVPHIYGQTGSK